MNLRWLLRAEGFALLLGAVALYHFQGFSWWLFALLFLVPDVSMLGYLAGPRVGAFCYNAAHATLLPWLVVGAGYVMNQSLLLAIGLIWFAHIGFDRALGYGLKYATSFNDTHLGRIGRS